MSILKIQFDPNAPAVVQSSSSAVIHAAAGKIDIPSWLFTLPDQEYQGCAKGHVAGGASVAPDGKRLSINVELVGPGLLIQHWKEEITEKQHIHLTSVSDMFVQGQRATVQLTWDMKVKAVSADTCEFTDTITLYDTPTLRAFVEKSGVPLDQMLAETKQAIDAHNAEETPNFARSIEKRTLSSGS